MSVTCPKCQAEIGEDSQYCSKCGSRVKPADEAPFSVTKTLKTPSKGVRIGATFAERYRIVDELGRGGMGIVYKAEDLRLKRMVALKFLPPELTQDEEAKDRFVLEARAAAAISHPNICTIHEIDEFEGQTYIAMEYVDGLSLRDLTKKGTIPVPQTLDLAIQVAGGLEEAHKKGIIHRDIKSANIMVTPAGQAKIMDFGLAKVSGGALITQEGVTMGTVAYMSPEQARGEKVDHRTDIWSLGVVLYEILSGQLPFWGEKESSILYSIEHKEHKPVRTINPDIPGELVAVIDRCLQKKPDARYKSAANIISELKRYQDSLRAEEAGFFNLKSLLRRLRKPKVAIPLAVILVALAALTTWQLNRQAKIRWAKEVALPEIERLCAENDYTPAFRLASEAKKYISDEQAFVNIWDSVIGTLSIQTEPDGADVYVRDYGSDDQEWTFLGRTPMEDMLTARGYRHLKITKSGHEDTEACFYLWSQPFSMKARLDREGSIPEGMVHINAASYSQRVFTVGPDFAFRPTLAGLQHLNPIVLGEYFIDKYEVTNQQYKKFIDDGGYSSRKYWKHPFTKDGQVLSWEEAVQLFVDKTGRPGPSTWELGDYPTDQADYPVRGVSWYEAAAFAEYADKSLPTVYHWNFAGGIADSLIGGYYDGAYVLPKSNFGGTGPLPVGQSHAYSAHGVYDLAGNVKEWCWNAQGENHYILGGAWDDPQYISMTTESFPPFFRLHNFGFRCMKSLGEDAVFQAASAPIEPLPPEDLSQYKPCSDEVFRVLKSLYDYEPTDLDATVHSKLEESQGIITEEVSFNAAYGGERVTAYIFLPKDGKPPYQVMIYFPGGAAFLLRSVKDYGLDAQIHWLARSNRAVVLPVYKQTFQRQESVEKWGYAVSRDMTIKQVQDLRRTIDYLETRPEFDADKIGFYGISSGAFYASIVPAIEERIKLTIITAAGLKKSYDFGDQFNFCPRVKVPVLMISGKYDYRIPIETRVKPLIDLFGTPEQDKQLKIYESGHTVWFDYQWKKDMVDFLDRYFGPAK